MPSAPMVLPGPAGGVVVIDALLVMFALAHPLGRTDRHTCGPGPFQLTVRYGGGVALHGAVEPMPLNCRSTMIDGCAAKLMPEIRSWSMSARLRTRRDRGPPAR